ncbi:MAG TPA: class III extradiol ring-cleavage dioxygenase [Candidatus Nanopelagicales bacterium]
MEHPYATHVRATRTAAPHRAWRPEDGPLPALYLSHGAPPLFEDADWMARLFAWARSLPRPRAILIVSAHWESAPLALTSAEAGTPLVYDFAGFDPIYYRFRYPTPAAGALADLVAGVLPDDAGLVRTTRGLDHGAWVPLMAMYPEADVPVLQLSIPTHGPRDLVALGQRLRPLRAEGVLVIGSGFMTHGLPFVEWSRPEVVPGWSRDFDAWASEALQRGDLDELAAFRDRAPGMPYAHPTVEHFTPMFLTLGAADPGAAPATTIDGWMYGLSRRSFQAA